MPYRQLRPDHAAALAAPYTTHVFHRAERARVAVVSLRGPVREISRALIYEFEDAIAALDSTDLVGPSRTRAPTRSAYLAKRALTRWRGLPRVAPASRAFAATQRLYDLLVVPIEAMQDLFLFGDLEPLLAGARQRVCWLVELWANDLPRHRGALPLLQQFDAVAVGCQGSVEPLRKLLGKPCFYLPPAVDTLRAWPGAQPPPRHIDVYSMGRRSPRTHAALLQLAEQRGWFYAYDTVRGNTAIDPAEHRALLANMIKRTRFFIANKAKVDVPEQTGGQEEVGFRFFEGAAGGTVMIGEPPRCAAFETLMGWEDAVLELPFGSERIEVVIDELLRQPHRVAAIRARNVAQALRRHDWAHRWQQLLTELDLPVPDAVRARLARLTAIADRTEIAVRPELKAT